MLIGIDMKIRICKHIYNHTHTYVHVILYIHIYTCACSTSYSVRLQEHICNEDWIIAEGCKGPGGERDVGLSFPSVECPWVRAKQLHIIRSKIERARLQNLKWNPTQEESHEFLIAFCLCSTAAGQKATPAKTRTACAEIFAANLRR